MRWQDLDLANGWWTIPAEHSKNGKLHRVPLADDAKAVIEARQPKQEERTGVVFQGRSGAGVEDRVKKAGADLSAVLGFEFRSHDLRRTAATRMAALGVRPAHISAVLNHVQGGPIATRTYMRHEFDTEKQVALEAWARELRRILAAKPQAGATVVPISKRRA